MDTNDGVHEAPWRVRLEVDKVLIRIQYRGKFRTEIVDPAHAFPDLYIKAAEGWLRVMMEEAGFIPRSADSESSRVEEFGENH